MKKKLPLLIFLLFCGLFKQIQAQNSDSTVKLESDSISIQTVKFYGIEITGTRKNYVEQLKKKGFTFKSENTELKYTILQGNISQTDVDIYVIGTAKTDLVWKVVIVYPEHKFWDDLLSEYEKIKSILNGKYETGVCYEQWKSNYKDDHEGYEMIALKLGYLEKFCYWLPQHIWISMEKGGFCQLSYENPVNQKLDMKEKQEIEEETY